MLEISRFAQHFGSQTSVLSVSQMHLSDLEESPVVSPVFGENVIMYDADSLSPIVCFGGVLVGVIVALWLAIARLRIKDTIRGMPSRSRLGIVPTVAGILVIAFMTLITFIFVYRTQFYSIWLVVSSELGEPKITVWLILLLVFGSVVGWLALWTLIRSTRVDRADAATRVRFGLQFIALCGLFGLIATTIIFQLVGLPMSTNKFWLALVVVQCAALPTLIIAAASVMVGMVFLTTLRRELKVYGSRGNS